MDNIMSKVNRKIRARALFLGFTMTELAKRANISQSALSLQLSGKRQMSAERLLFLSALLQILCQVGYDLDQIARFWPPDGVWNNINYAV